MDNPQSRDTTPDLYSGSDRLQDPANMSLTSGTGHPINLPAVPSDGAKSAGPEQSALAKFDVNGPSAILSHVQVEVPAKRKRSHDNFVQSNATLSRPDGVPGPMVEPDTKRIRSEKRSHSHRPEQHTEKLHGLTISLWQRVFAFVPPVPLARLLRVCRHFKTLLNAPAKESLAGRIIGTNVIDYTESNRVWEKSHRLFARGLPVPFNGQQELDMWRLIKGNQCQQCGQSKSLATTSGSTSTFTSGPGKDHVRIVWPFQIRLCGDCLRSSTHTDDELTLSGSFPAFLKDALPAIYLSESNDYVSESKHATLPAPLGLKLVKSYFKLHIEAIKRRYDHIKEFNPENASEWVQSLSDERLAAMKDSERWENWEQKGALAKLNTRPARGKRTNPDVAQSTQAISFPPQAQAPSLSSQIVSPIATGFAPYASAPYQQPHTVAHQTPMPNLASPGGAPGAPPKAARNYVEIQAARAARRAEIERRAMLLQPPMQPKLLEHMESFRAALQISIMLDDAQWEFLKVRLESERAGAEERLAQQPEPHHQPAPALPVPQFTQPNFAHAHELQLFTNSETPGPPGTNDDEPKGEIHIDEIEVDPNSSRLQKRLAHFADQVTLGKWNGGRSLNRESCAQFAAEVLLQVRKNYYEEAFGGQHATDPSLPHFLTLENMKWVHETRIKPLTEQFHKDIFLCNGCESNTKGYGFEAVIQHYAAKHTTSLSLGSVVVHWKAEWPEKPPFHPNPMLVKALAITSSTSAQLALQNGNHEFRETYSGSAPYATIQQSLSPTGRQQGQAHTDNGSFPSMVYGQNGYPAQAPPGVSGSYGHSQPPGPPSSIQALPPGLPSYQGPVSHPAQSSISQYQATPAGAGMPYAVPPSSDPSMPTAETYRKHLTEMAKLARELWFATASVKGLPGTVRTQVIIHHACERFVSSFQLQPGVAMFLDGLNHEAAMRPLRSLNGFSCKACATGQVGALPPSDRKQSTLPHLLGHFRTAHAEIPGLDWRKDMVQLPQLTTITDLVNAPGMDDSKFSLLAAAFPGAYPYPLPSLAALQRKSVPVSAPEYSKSQQAVPQGAYQIGSVVTPVKATGYSGIITPQQPDRKTDSPGEDEYDPRRPSYLGHIVSSGANTSAYVPRNDHPHPSHGVSYREPIIKQEVGEADRFLEDLRPRIPSSHAEPVRRGYGIDSSIPLDRQQNSYSYGHENLEARRRNSQYAANDNHYYSDAQGRSDMQLDPLPERYMTRYVEPVPRDDYGRVGHEPVAYYHQLPDGRLVPATESNAPRIVYERDLPARERGYEYVAAPQSDRYYDSEIGSTTFQDSNTTYTYSAASREQQYAPQQARVVYVDRREMQPDEGVVSYDPNHPREGYRREPVYGGDDPYHR